MKSSLRRLVMGFAFLVLTVVGATIGYMSYGWTFLDSIYMVIITIFGVGFGEVNPITIPSLRWFTMLVIVCGTTSTLYILGGFLQIITEGEIQKAITSRKMNKEIEALHDHVIVCGYGRVGQILAKKLRQAKQSFVLIDNDPEKIHQAKEQGYLILDGNASSEIILFRAGIAKARILATVLPNDALNVFITLTAREINPKLRIIARGEFPSTEKKLKLAGADQVVLPSTIGAERITHLITHPSALDFLGEDEGRMNLNELLGQINLQLEEILITGNSPLVNQPINELEIKGEGGFIVVAIRQKNAEIVLHPSHAFILQEGDTVILLGHQGDLHNFARRYSIKRDLRYRGASI